MHRKIQLILLATSLILVSATFSDAQQKNSLPETDISPEKQVLIKEYFELTGGRAAVQKTLDATFVNLNNTLPLIISAQVEENANLTAAQKAELQKDLPNSIARMSKSFRVELNKEFDYAELIETVNFTLLNKYFNENELKDLIAFYKTPTAQKAIAVQPQLLGDATAKINAILIPAVQKVIKKVTDIETKELMKKVTPKQL